MRMFCRQCEQTAAGRACTSAGVCGKSAETAALQDLLVYLLAGIGFFSARARENGRKSSRVDRFVREALFSTVTNVNFDPERLEALLREGIEVRKEAQVLSGIGGADDIPEPCRWQLGGSRAELLEQASGANMLSNNGDSDAQSVKELLLYGMKGTAAYADHAGILGAESDRVDGFLARGLMELSLDRPDTDWFGLVMELGKVNLECMEMLSKAHIGRFGSPEPTRVVLGVKKGPAIIVSGHDLLDLHLLLSQSAGTGVNVYTHGEMLPAHGYPGLKKYPHLAGHFGSAWQNQQKEFDRVPAAILMTTNCIQKPRDSYRDRIFTTGLVAWPDVRHIPGKGEGKDFSPVIKKARELGGFPADAVEKEVTVGFGHDALLKVAGALLEAIKAGKVRRLFLIGGCDGAKPGRNYYTEFAKAVPPDCLMLTLACGKFRFNRLDFGTAGGFPRLIDVGQCNDAYSAIVVAAKLAEALDCTVNDLPLSLILSWYEQKAVCILITLLSLGIRNIKLGPSLPAFVSPGVLSVLAEKFGISPITTPENDLREILGGEEARG